MEPVIHVQPIEGWGYYASNKNRLSEELVEIAYNEKTKTSVYMTEENDKPFLYVYRDDRKVFLHPDNRSPAILWGNNPVLPAWQKGRLRRDLC